MDDPRSSGRPELDGRREPPDEQRLDEVVDLLSVRDAGEHRVLPADEYASVPHHDQQEASLTIREAERCERSSALGGRTIVIGRVWVPGGPSEHLEAYAYQRSEIFIP